MQAAKPSASVLHNSQRAVDRQPEEQMVLAVPVVEFKIARKIKLMRDRRVRLLLWSAVYYQYSLGLRCLPLHHSRLRRH
jgi:hypothetical protein